MTILANLTRTFLYENSVSFKYFSLYRRQKKSPLCSIITISTCTPEVESKEKHGVWDPMPDLTITSPYVHSRVDSNTFTMGNPMPVEKSTSILCQSRLYPPVRDLGFGLSPRMRAVPITNYAKTTLHYSPSSSMRLVRK